MNKDQEIAKVTEQLDEILGELRGNVDAMYEILTRPAPPLGDEDSERLTRGDE